MTERSSRPFATIAAFAAAALAAASMTVTCQAQDRDRLRWVDVADWRIEGRAFADRAAPFDRLPAAARADVRDQVWKLSRDCAGMAVRFRSDAAEVHVRYRLTRARLAMTRMPATGVSGVDLYARHDDGTLRWVAVSRPDRRDVEQRLCTGLAEAPRGGREFLLYLPLYNGLERLELGVPKDAALEPVAAPAGKPIVVYGTSIAHGACASRPGMAWPAVLSRMLGREVINLGFSGNGTMEAAVTEHVATIDAAVYVIDCLPNMDAAQVRARATPLVERLRAARPDAQILLVEDRTYANAWILPERAARHAASRRALRETFAVFEGRGDDKVQLLPGAGLLGDDGEATTDGSHPNDLGMVRQARAVAAVLRDRLR